MARLIDAYQAIDIIDEWLGSVGTVMVGKGLSSYGELIGCIEDAPTLTQPNEPLTIAQLREMDGEPVYWPKEKMWLIVYLNHPDFGDCALNREGQYLPLDKCERRKVYRRPPEGEGTVQE